MHYFQESPPFEMGTTLKGTQTLDGTTSTINESVLGTRCAFQDVNYATSASTRTLLSGEKILAIALRNTSGIALLPKRLVRLDLTAGRGMLKNADGYSVLLAHSPVVLVDPFLPSTGVADDDIFWGLYSGPALCLTPAVAADFNTAITAGAPLVAATGSTSGNSTGGRVANVTLPGQTGDTRSVSNAIGLVGWALSSRTTDITNSDILVKLGLRV